MIRFNILFFYYNRPVISRNALQSLLDSTYQDFHVSFIDDSSDVPGKPVVEEFFKDKPEMLSKFTFYHTNDTKEAKSQRGAIFGQFANQAIKDYNSDIVIMLNDDDALYPTYLENLNTFYQENPDIKYAYSHFILFSPLDEDFNEVKIRTEASDYLRWTHPINPYNQCDSSQVSWRRECNTQGNCWFASPLTANLDADLYSKFFNTYGNCVWTGFIGQFKGWHPKQLGKRGVPFENTE